ncbi:VOC family protein [Streptomyces sp. NPDC005438]|uniref:VOC family protein n=1 Tax=Streptomyces sp. NPDC005438 TaxID=3156880 RepID=UPI0033A6D525
MSDSTGPPASPGSPAILDGAELPPGYGTVNPFVAVRGPGGAAAFIDFLQRVLDGRETPPARAVDADDLLIHAEVRIGASTVMLCDAKPHWSFTPALLQVYVRDVDAVVARARAEGAEVVTEPTPFHGHQRLARVQDPWSNLWWFFEYGEDSVAPSQAPPTAPTWRADPSAPPSYVHRTVDAALTTLREPERP